MTKLFRSLPFFLLPFWGCIAEPEFPLVPEIEFKSIENLYGQQIPDSVVFSITFKDGDGDLGLAQDDTTGAYARLGQDKKPNKFYHNIFVNTFRKRAGESNYQLVLLQDGSNESGRYPVLNLSGRPRPLEGTLTRSVEVFVLDPAVSPEAIFRPGDSIYYEIEIADRALNVSNKVRTKAVMLYGIGRPKPPTTTTQ